MRRAGDTRTLDDLAEDARCHSAGHEVEDSETEGMLVKVAK